MTEPENDEHDEGERTTGTVRKMVWEHMRHDLVSPYSSEGRTQQPHHGEERGGAIFRSPMRSTVTGSSTMDQASTEPRPFANPAPPLVRSTHCQGSSRGRGGHG